jgi:TIR domain
VKQLLYDTTCQQQQQWMCRAAGVASGAQYNVFISHAGPQKASFAVWLQRELRRHGVSAFLDETSLHLGDAADAEMQAALRSCSIVVIVLTPDFLRSPYCMSELRWALHPCEPHPSLVQRSTGPDQQLSAGGSAGNRQVQLHSAALQHGRAPPLVLPVFYQASNVSALQQDMQQQLAQLHSLPSGEQQRLKQASADLDMVCRITGDRQDSHGK